MFACPKIGGAATVDGNSAFFSGFGATGTTTMRTSKMNERQLPWWQTTTAAAGIVVLAAIVLLSMGRTMWGEASGFGLWSGDIHGPLNSQLLFDAYTFSHINHGLLFFLLLWVVAADRLSVDVRLLVATLLESTWEVVENTPFVIERFREATIAQGYYGDSVLNSIGDIFACTVGFAIAATIDDNVWTVVLFLAVEAALALWIRDNVLLNLLMLIYPVPGIREWQAAG